MGEKKRKRKIKNTGKIITYVFRCNTIDIITIITIL